MVRTARRPCILILVEVSVRASVNGRSQRDAPAYCGPRGGALGKGLGEGGVKRRVGFSARA